MWVDANHDGVSQPNELVTLAQAGIASIDLTAQPTGRRDRFGNYFRYRAVVHLTNGRQTVVWDVFLAARLNGGGASAAGLPMPFATGLAGLGAFLLAVGLASLIRPKPQPQAVGEVPAAAASRTGVACVTTLGVLLLWPSATFGQGARDWQVVEYPDNDAVGSVRVVTNASGQVVGRHDFLPFGEELAPQIPPPEKRLFVGQERDAETGFDHFLARELAGNVGRFNTPDPLGGRLADLQSQNKYAYARNNPLRFLDPTGLYMVDEGCWDDEWCTREATRFENVRRNNLASKDPLVARAAAAYGNPGVPNGYVVHFGKRGAKQENCRKGASSCVKGDLVADEKTQRFYFDKNVYFKGGLNDETFQREIVHEGSHIADDFDFLYSYDPKTGMFDSAANFTPYMTEMKAFFAGNAVGTTPYVAGSCSSNMCPYRLEPGGNILLTYDTIDLLLKDPRNPYLANGLYQLAFPASYTAPRK